MNQNKRHKSVINPSDLFQMQSPQKTTVSSIGSSSSVNKLPLRSNSIFAYQEYDEFSSFIDNTNNYKTSSSIQSPEDINNNSLNQSRDSSSYSDSEETFEKIDQKKTFYKKRMSDGNVFYNNKQMFKNNDDYFQKKLVNYNNQSPIMPSYYPQMGGGLGVVNQFNFPHQEQNTNAGYVFKRNSYVFLPGFNLNSYQQKSKFSMFFDNNQQTNNNNNSNNGTGNKNFPVNLLNGTQGGTRIEPGMNEDKFILDNLNSLLNEQNQCRVVQEKLEEKKYDNAFIKTFFQNIEGNLSEVINHQFGNYVIQKFFEILVIQKDKSLVMLFFEKIKDDLFKISVNNYGTRVFQKSLEKLEEAGYENFETDELNEIKRCLFT